MNQVHFDSAGVPFLTKDKKFGDNIIVETFATLQSSRLSKKWLKQESYWVDQSVFPREEYRALREDLFECQKLTVVPGATNK